MRSNSFRSFKWLQFNYISSHSIQTKWVKIPAWDRGHVYLSVQDGVAWLPIDTRGIEKRRDEYAFSHVERSKTELNRKVDHVTEINIFIQRHSVAIYHSARHLIDLTTGKNMSSKSELHTFSLNRIFNYAKMLNTTEPLLSPSTPKVFHQMSKSNPRWFNIQPQHFCGNLTRAG